MYCEDMMLGLLDGLERSPYESEEWFDFEKRIHDLATRTMRVPYELESDEELERTIEQEADLRAAAEIYFAERAAEEEAYRMSA